MNQTKNQSIFKQMNSKFLKSSYSFHLPEALIAAEPLAQRDEARLMVVHRSTRAVEHRRVSDLPEYFNAGDAIVVNNTRVFRARLLGERVGTGGKVEFFLLKPLDGDSAHACIWQGLMKTGAKISAGFQFKILGSQVFGDLQGEVLAREETTSGALFTARFNHPPLQADVGEVPLPPYIVAKRAAKEQKVEGSVDQNFQQLELRTYNTIFAEKDGSVAAPTAGRHFTQALIDKLKSKGISWNEITLHVGLGTFKPVMTDDIREHLMHAEPATISEATAKIITHTKQQGHRILTVGTTTTRALEGSVSETGQVMPGTRDVNLFIHPGSEHLWRISSAILTNFHLPESTLLMMIASFLEQGSTQPSQPGDGIAWLLELYQEAIRQQYRFYSYGDAMLIL
jgi:S-adenosylmethionine:tRNA ribosyltransferase-isomerase